MTLRTIITPENPLLRKRASSVKDLADPAFQKLVDDLIETMREAPGVGLAAPQVAVPQRVAVVEYAAGSEDLPEGEEPPPPKLYVLVNPEITARSDEMLEGVEGCLSVPGYAAQVSRHAAITVKALNRKGRPVKIKAHGWLARIFQHEIDHLDGVLMIDRAAKVWKTKDSEQISVE